MPTPTAPVVVLSERASVLLPLPGKPLISVNMLLPDVKGEPREGVGRTSRDQPAEDVNDARQRAEALSYGARWHRSALPRVKSSAMAHARVHPPSSCIVCVGYSDDGVPAYLQQTATRVPVGDSRA